MALLSVSHCIGLCTVGVATVLMAPPVPFPSATQSEASGFVSQSIQEASSAEAEVTPSSSLATSEPSPKEPPTSMPAVAGPVESTIKNEPSEQGSNLGLPSFLSVVQLVDTTEEPVDLADTKQPPSVATPEPAEQLPPPIVGTANRITVPSIEIDIAVQPGVYDSAAGTWQVDDSSAFHASTTVPVNDTNGTTLIYGHAKWGIFGALPDLTVGDEATVYTSEGTKFVYELESLRQVDPTDVSMLTADGEPRLILQTCSGLFDQHRTLALFAFKEVL